VLRHLDGIQRVADKILHGLPRLPDNSQEHTVVDRRKPHEATGPHHGLELGFDRRGISAFLKLFANLPREMPELLLERRSERLKRLVHSLSNVLDLDA
jgi:hypothetical protein